MQYNKKAVLIHMTLLFLASYSSDDRDDVWSFSHVFIILKS